MDDGNIHFPLHVQAGDEDFVIERDDDDATSPTSADYYTSPDGSGVRLKRRRRCGQCGPCQVKENCNKCHFCARRDVLKQTCMYRKCVYLRSKPKPYTRPKDVQVLQPPPGSSVPMSHTVPLQPTSPQNHEPNDVNNILGTNSSMGNSSALPYPGVTSPPMERPCSQNEHSVLSPKNSEPYPTSLRPSFPEFGNTGMRHPSHASVSQIQQVPAAPTISSSVSSFMNQHSVVPPGLCGIMDPSSLPAPHQMVPLPPPYQGIGSINERTFGPQMMGPQHPSQIQNGTHSSLQSQHKHPSLSFREMQEFKDLQHYQGFVGPHMSPHLTQDASSCIYPHGMRGPMVSSSSSYGNMAERPSMFGLMDRPTTGPSAPLYFPTEADMFRHFPSLPPSYRHPSSRYSQNFSTSPYQRYSSMGMPPPPPPPNLPLHHQGGHNSQPGWPSAFPPQVYSSCDQTDQCPKNGCCPPASQTMGLDTPAMQERYANINFKSPTSPFRGHGHSQGHGHTHHSYNPFRGYSGGILAPLPDMEHSRGFMSTRPDSALSNDSGFMSLTSDIECDISIDDCQLNAVVRSDGCNSLRIEIDESLNSSFSSNKNSKSPQIGEITSISLQEFGTDERNLDKQMSPEIPPDMPEKYTIKGTVLLKQDLGDEGIIQLELPGSKVFLEPNCYLDDDLAKCSSNVTELLEFINKPVTENVVSNSIDSN